MFKLQYLGWEELGIMQ